MEKNKQGLPPDYYLRTYKDNGEQRAQWYNRCCAMLDVKVCDRYACTVEVKMPQDNRDVKWTWLRDQAIARAKELSRIVRQSKEKYITVEIYGIVDYNGQIITESKQAKKRKEIKQKLNRKLRFSLNSNKSN